MYKFTIKRDMIRYSLLILLSLYVSFAYSQKAELPKYLISYENGVMSKSPAIPGGQFAEWSKQKFDPQWGRSDRRTEIIDESLAYLKMFNDSNSVVFLHVKGFNHAKGLNVYYIAVLASDGIGYSIFRCHTTAYEDYSYDISLPMLDRKHYGHEGNWATINPIVLGDNYFLGFSTHDNALLKVKTRKGEILKIPFLIEGRPTPYYNPY